ncbi:MAG TPA: MATE family efflux transporter [Lachnospiraceae bacterium]|nr:MATE family efflux transporter [Lachnospiraceae bacterium]
MKIKEYLGNGEFYKSTAMIAIPIALQSLITMGVNLLDNIMLGSLGEIPLSASSLAVQYIGFYNICCMGLGMGASVLVSRFWGMKELDSLRKTVSLMIRFTLVIGLLFAIPAFFIPSEIMQMYTTEVPVIAQGVLYLKWSVPCILLMGFSTTCTIVLRSTGQTKVPLIGSCFAFGINLVANWIFIFGNLGAPRMEIEGAALGTLISRIFEFFFICGYLLFVEKKICYRVKHLFMTCKDMLRNYLTISFPVLISDVLLGLGTNTVAMVMGRIGSDFVAANSITMVTQQLSTVLIQGISQAGCIVTGHHLGAGEYEKAKKQGWTFLFLGFAIGMVAGLFIIITGPLIISIYNITEETKQIAQQLMLSIGIIVIFQSANSIITKGVLRGGGDTKCLMIADNVFMWVVSLPLGYLAGLYFHLPPFWIYFCLKIDQFLKAFWCIWRLKSGKWIKKIK